jgi:prevent-host-death family protein
MEGSKSSGLENIKGRPLPRFRTILAPLNNVSAEVYISVKRRIWPVKHVTTVAARAQFSEIVNRAAFGKERVTLTRRGKEIVAVVPIEDMKLLEALEDKIDLEEARAALAGATKKGTISWEKLKSELGI